MICGTSNAVFRFFQVMADKVYDTPSEVEAEDGNVVVDGPDGVAVTLLPEAAIETSERLLAKGTQAHGQRIRNKQIEGEG